MELFFSSAAGGILLLSLLVVFQVTAFPRNVIVITVGFERVRGFLDIVQSKAASNSQV